MMAEIEFDSNVKPLVEAASEVLITKAVPEAAALLGMGGAPIPDVDIHDFASYVFLREPELALTEAYGDYSAGLDEFLDQILQIIVEVANQEVVNDVYSEGGFSNERAVEGADIREEHHHDYWSHTGTSFDWIRYYFTYRDDYREMIIEESYDLFLEHLAVELYELVVRVYIEHEPRVYEVFRKWLVSWMNRYEDAMTAFPIEDIVDIWRQSYLPILGLLDTEYPDTSYLTYIDNSIKYSFVPFREDEVNFGLRLVYRQEWRKLGNQDGRILKTIPLGPKQVEKVTITATTSQTVRHEAETTQATEQTRESQVSESNSSEVVSESANSFNWDVETKASYSMGAGSASLSAGVGGEQSSSAGSTKKTLNESAESSASKQRKETSLNVSTERSASEEQVRTSEIHNPNEEIAITYIYKEMYQKFEVYTSLAELQSVVFVPERVPHPMEIDAQFVRRYDWILRGALLDQSFEEDLDRVIQDIDENPVLDSDDANPDPFLDSFTKSSEAMSTFSAFSGDMPDFFKSTGENYMKQADKQRLLDNRLMLRELRNDRLFRHIRDNILHYMRAIWAQEDPEQRMQRYRTIQVPTQWEFVPDEGSNFEGMTGEWDGEYVPVPESSRRLVDIINPAGPIGWAVNYAIFYLKSDPNTLALNKALSRLRAYYVRYEMDFDGPGHVLSAAVLEPHWNAAEYHIGFDGAEVHIDVVTPYTTYQIPIDEVAISDDRRILEFEGIHLYFDDSSPLSAGDAYEVSIAATGILQDPEVLVKKVMYPLPPLDQEQVFFDRILGDMLGHLPALNEVITGETWDGLDETERAIVREAYHEYLMKVENTRRLLLKSRNPMIDLLVGDTPALEQFKRLHRAVDVVKALEEYSGKRYEGIRKRSRIESQIYADPDIENVTVVGSDVELKDLVGAGLSSAADPHPPEPEPSDDEA